MNSRAILTSGIVLLNLVGLVGTFAGPVSAARTRVGIKPQNVTLGAGQLQQFTAEVRGTSNTHVNWSISDSSGPTSGSISATGLYTAPATISSGTTVTVMATSAANPAVVGHATINLTVGATPTALAIATTSLPNGQQGSTYTASLTASGGATPYTWSMSSGSLPAGVSLNAATAGLSGTPTASGTSSFTVQVTDSTTPTAQTATESLSIAVTAAATPVSITTTSLANGQQGSIYSANLAASGGTTPYTWSISSGSLPAGVSLNASTGALSGTPMATGTSSFTVQVTDSTTPTAQTATKSLSITVTATVTAVSITSTSLASGQVGMSYSQTLSATGGTTPYTWSLTSGTLPSGLTLNASTGLISGTPTAVANATALTFKVTDSTTPTSQTNTVSLTITITGPSVSLSWVASTSPATSGYNVYRSSTSGSGYTEINVSTVLGLTFTDTIVVSGQTYYYVTTAVDSSGNESPYSNQVQVTVP